MLGFLNKYKYIGMLLGIIGSFFYGIKVGADGQIAKAAKFEIAEKAKDAEKVKAFNEYKQLIRQETNAKIRNIMSKAATACADTSFADMGLLKRTSED